MSSSDDAVTVQDSRTQQPTVVEAISDGLANVSIQGDNVSSISQDSPTSIQNNSGSRPFTMYSRSQLLFLHKSPLVQLPSGMPALKDWFGTENDQASAKKDFEAPVPAGNARDRRFRRDAEDGASARQSFRGAAITQPSQMGNFKHQSIRATDRDRDKDCEREQDRDKLKEGQERLRNLSDKYDRDRRALSSLSQMRPKDRELAPHLVNPGSRVTSQGQHTASSRVSDSRDPPRKKEGESNEDWRRGTDQPRMGRDQNGRRDRDDRERERPRSRVRDSSRTHREGSPSSRRDDRRTDRDDGYGGHRRDKEDRDRDLDRDSELDDPRRWRDDGKRDERMAARRERENRERERERELRDRRDRPAWEGTDRSDRRWAGDDRDNRGKKLGGKDRRVGDDVKDREDRKDREKEPAWMDTYIPSNSNGGVIGGQRPGGELDGIQAFRKEMQQKDKSTSPSNADLTAESQVKAALPVQPPESQLDEIQLFRLMMKREEEKKKSDSPLILHPPSIASESSLAGNEDLDSEDHASAQEIGANLTLAPALLSKGHSQTSSFSSTRQPDGSAQKGADSVSVLPSALSTPSPQPSVAATFSRQELDSTDKLKPSSSRLFSTPLSLQLPAPQATAKPSVEAIIAPNHIPQSHHPAGSRLLALGSRTPQIAVGLSARSASSQSPVSFTQKNGTIGSNTGISTAVNLNSHIGELPPHFSPAVESVRASNGFSPFEEHRDAPALLTSSGVIHRGPFSGDRNIFATEQVRTPEPGLGGSHPTQSFEPIGPGIAAAKGSRFAKFFDGKGKDNQAIGLSQGSIGTLGPSQSTAPQKMDVLGLLPPHNHEARAMEDIFAMLNNSAQAQIHNAAPELSNLDVGYGSPSNLHALQNPQTHPLLPNHSRLDSLYDSRLDDRNFVPDGMVPGLRSVPPPRSRQNSAMFSDFPEEPIQFNGQRGPAQMYHGPVPSIHLQHGNMGRSGGMPIQAAQFRSAPSPNHLAAAQRLPPGLANLGGRPPHEPNQYVNSSIGMTNGGLHGSVHSSGASQQPFNNFQQSAGLGFGGGPQMRGPHPAAHHMQSTLGHNPLQGLVPTGNLGSSQAQLLGLAANGIPGGLRGPGGGFGQQGPQVQPPHMAMRQHQQSQQQIPPHMLPLHLQQQGFGGGANNQPAHDLMALLMSGARRD
ncbi:hypothetical protein BS17DRAFT_771518 [Gyrodon lividus]|nr:hypothetical protein BS17DRAFT_771518 [Gyrodon lividus]